MQAGCADGFRNERLLKIDEGAPSRAAHAQGTEVCGRNVGRGNTTAPQSSESDMFSLLGLYTRIQSRAAARRRENGAAAAEYCLLVALISIGIIGAVTGIGGKLTAMFANAESALPH